VQIAIRVPCGLRYTGAPKFAVASHGRLDHEEAGFSIASRVSERNIEWT
jgi:hypothetical protein